jgi:hypothetical protein
MVFRGKFTVLFLSNEEKYALNGSTGIFSLCFYAKWNVFRGKLTVFVA